MKKFVYVLLEIVRKNKKIVDTFHLNSPNFKSSSCETCSKLQITRFTKKESKFKITKLDNQTTWNFAKSTF